MQLKTCPSQVWGGCRISLEGEVKRVKGMLGNPNFVNKAPEKKVNEERAKQVKYEEMLAKVAGQLALVESKLK